VVRGYGSAYPRSCGGEVGSLATPLRNEQRHVAPPHRLAVELSGQGKRRTAIAREPTKLKNRGLGHVAPASRVSQTGVIATTATLHP
jgi:hypothetical protein